MGLHVQNYFDLLKKEDASAHKKQFSQWIKCLADSKVKTIDELYKKVHAEIRKNPDRPKVVNRLQPIRRVVSKGHRMIMENSKGDKWLRLHKISHAYRKHKVAQRIRAAMGMDTEDFNEVSAAPRKAYTQALDMLDQDIQGARVPGSTMHV